MLNQQLEMLFRELKIWFRHWRNIKLLYKRKEKKIHSKSLIICILVSLKPITKWSISKLRFYLNKWVKQPILRNRLKGSLRKYNHSEKSSLLMLHLLIMKTSRLVRFKTVIMLLKSITTSWWTLQKNNRNTLI